MDGVRTCLWYDGNGEQAARFYASVFPTCELGGIFRYGDAGPGEAGTVGTLEFRIGDQQFFVINGGPQFPFTEAVSIQILCDDQAEADRYWDALTAEGEEGQCGWLKDRYGLSWQIVPRELMSLLGDPDPERARRATAEMLTQRRLDLAAIHAAADRTD